MKENNKENNRKPKNGLIFLTVALMILALAFGFKKNSDLNELEKIFIFEKKAIQNDLDELLQDYKGVKTKNKLLSIRLKRELKKITSLRDSVKELAGNNYAFIIEYRKRVHTLERENHDLFAAVDSLHLVNKKLLNENVIIVEELEEVNNEADELKIVNKELKGKIKIASVINMSPIDAYAMKERSSGKLTTTTRSRKTDAFKIHFKLLENKVVKRGKVRLYVQVLDKNGRIISQKGRTKIGNKQVLFSDKIIVDYKNKSVDILSLVLVNRQDISKGLYDIIVYTDTNSIRKTTISLN